MADLIEAFNDCVDRLNGGESIDSCLYDYPEHGERLRQLLQTGALFTRAHDAGVATADVRQEVQTHIVETYRTRSKPHRNWFVPLAAVASVTLLVGIVAVLSLATSGSAPQAFDMTRAAIEAENAEVIVAINMTETQAVFISREGDGTPAAATPLPFGTPMPTALSGEATVVVIPAATLAPIILTPSPSSPDIGDVSLTATPLTVLVISTATYEGSLPTALPDTGGGEIVPTSVVGMSPATATMTTTATGTPLPTMTLNPSATLEPGTPTMPPTPAPTQQSQQAALQPPTPPDIIPMNAGEIDDNERWDTYLLYRGNFLEQYGYAVHDVDVTGRQIIRVSDQQGLPVLGARVQVYAGLTLVSETLTYATGQTLFFPNARPESRGQQSFRVEVSKGQSAVEFTLDPQQGPVWDVTLENIPRRDRVRLDVLFLLDTTGSMGDELAQLQNNIRGISWEISALPGNVDARYGLVTYRDRGDAYVTQIYDFTPEVSAFQASLNNESADGGGDEPESLNQGLHDAVQNVTWRGDDTIKLVFLVADAPPHLDYPQDYDYAQEMVVAAQRGIKIHPIASSGLNQIGEYIFRQIAQYTMGHFIFLTYEQGSSGDAGLVRPDLNVGTPDDPTTQQDQSDYTVQRLDDLVLRLITEELSALNAKGTAGSPVLASKVDTSQPPMDYTPVILAVIVGVSFLVGYSFNLRRSFAENRKRKNSEREADWTEHRF